MKSLFHIEYSISTFYILRLACFSRMAISLGKCFSILSHYYVVNFRLWSAAQLKPPEFLKLEIVSFSIWNDVIVMLLENGYIHLELFHDLLLLCVHNTSNTKWGCSPSN